MPIKLKRCKANGCSFYGQIKNSYCDQHQSLNFQNYKMKVGGEVYGSSRWKKLRLFVLRKNPMCKNCRFQIAKEVDHIKPLRLGGDAFNFENLQPLCKACHLIKTKKDNKNK